MHSKFGFWLRRTATEFESACIAQLIQVVLLLRRFRLAQIQGVFLPNSQNIYFFSLILILLPFYCSCEEDYLEKSAKENKIVLSTKRIYLKDYPDAFNPSLISFESGYLLTFRFSPNRWAHSWLSYIGVVRLNEAFDPISEPQLLSTRFIDSKTPSQSEDARIVSYQGKLFLTYNDNIDVCPTIWKDKREIFLAELHYDSNRFYLSKPLKLFHEQKKNNQWQQKNWVPFEWEQKLLFTYTINPHEVIFPNLYNGACYTCYETSPPIHWAFGTLRGGTPPVLFDGEYLSFFHSCVKFSSNASANSMLWHYFMGAYTFSNEPPFKLTKMSPAPIVGDHFYTQPFNEKCVIFPGGCVIAGSKIYLAYGKNDCEMWIATLDKEELEKSLIAVP
jgi:predicted GH43/DUF377 family glycosyl hydrolase